MGVRRPKRWRPKKILMSQGSLTLKRRKVPTRKQLIRKIANFVKKQRSRGPRRFEQ